jgi:hypothetical protein
LAVPFFNSVTPSSPPDAVPPSRYSVPELVPLPPSPMVVPVGRAVPKVGEEIVGEFNVGDVNVLFVSV